MWLKSHHFKQNSVAKRLNFKLSKRYYGPFKILERIGLVAYKLELPEESRIHLVFHVAMLKAYYSTIPLEPGVVPEDMSMRMVEPIAIIDQRWTKFEDEPVRQVLAE